MVYERIINNNIYSIEQTIYINIIKESNLASKIYSTEIFKYRVLIDIEWIIFI